MSDSSSTASNTGVGFLGLLGIVFITLKLTGVIAWSWTWVLAPLWIPAALVMAIVVLVMLSLAIAQARGQNPFN